MFAAPLDFHQSSSRCQELQSTLGIAYPSAGGDRLHPATPVAEAIFRMRNSSLRALTGSLAVITAKTPLFTSALCNGHWSQGVHTVLGQTTGTVIRKEEPTPGVEFRETVPSILATVSFTI